MRHGNHAVLAANSSNKAKVKKHNKRPARITKKINKQLYNTTIHNQPFCFWNDLVQMILSNKWKFNQFHTCHNCNWNWTISQGQAKASVCCILQFFLFYHFVNLVCIVYVSEEIKSLSNIASVENLLKGYDATKPFLIQIRSELGQLIWSVTN